MFFDKTQDQGWMDEYEKEQKFLDKNLIKIVKIKTVEIK